MSKHKTLRFPTALLSKLEQIAKSERVSFSSVARRALKLGVAEMEKEAEPATEAPRRKVLSRGVS